MDTVILPPTPENIQAAAAELRRGQLVGMPTETVYGLGANAFDAAAVRANFAAKGRPADKPLHVPVPGPEEAEPLCQVTDTARALMAAFCPGPLTMLLHKKPCVPDVVTAGLPSVAVRMPSHPVCQQLMRACGLPIAAPSANTSGKPSPTTARHVLNDLKGKLHIILEGGACQVGLESTVLDLTSPVPTVLRPGGVTPEMLLTVLPQVQVADSVMRPLRAGEKALSPGMSYRHYAPTGKLTVVKGSQSNVEARIRALTEQAAQSGQQARILAFAEHLPAYDGLETVSIGSLAQPETAARRLFAVLRQADQDKVPVLFSEALPPEGLGLAIMNRLMRAAGFAEINADRQEALP